MGPALQNLQTVDSKLAKRLHDFISNVFIYFLHPSRLLNTCTFSRPTGPSPLPDEAARGERRSRDSSSLSQVPASILRGRFYVSLPSSSPR